MNGKTKYEITLICTHHSELGNCNSLELYRTIEDIRPDVIFEELPPSLHAIAYQINEPIALETEAIKRYLKNRKAIQIPIDSYPVPNELYKDFKNVLNRIDQSDTVDSQTLRKLIQDQKASFSHYGLRVINSDENDKRNVQINLLRENILTLINDDKLFRIYYDEKKIRLLREYEIMRNIYKYSIENPFNKAIMLIGSGHRKSILNLIDEFQKESELKLIWKIY